jgi:hypothetical protein
MAFWKVQKFAMTERIMGGMRIMPPTGFAIRLALDGLLIAETEVYRALPEKNATTGTIPAGTVAARFANLKLEEGEAVAEAEGAVEVEEELRLLWKPKWL